MGKQRFYGKSEIFPFTSVENPAIITERKTKCARSSMDRASDSGSECWGFESLRAYQKERHAEKRVFLFGFRRLKGGSTLRHLNARGRQSRPCAIPGRRPGIYAPLARAAQKGRWAVFLLTVSKMKISILTAPSSSSQAAYRLRRAFSFHCKTHRALILLLLASKPDPLRWAPVWGRRCAAVFSYRKEMSILTAPFMTSVLIAFETL